jgi:glycosyltransferase involved in cell wall biosynthesis
MSTPRTSIVMTTYNRPNQLRNTLESIKRQAYKDLEIIVVDDGVGDAETPAICRAYPVRYFKTTRPLSSNNSFRNPSYPNNVGLRQAVGDIVILQNAECKHVDPNTIEKLTGMVTDTNAVFAKVSAFHQNGSFNMIYCGTERPVPFFFCGAIKRSWIEKLRGFDEDFTGAGYDDDDFASRLAKEGVQWVFSGVEVHHQWHPQAGVYSWEPMQALFAQKYAAMYAGTIGTARNLDREWGEL